MKKTERSAHAVFVGLTLALTAGAVAYRLLVIGHLQQTAALFVALPAGLALLLAIMPPAKSATGMIAKGVTLGLLLSGPLLGEGFICILMASPLFLLVGTLIGLGIDAARRRGITNRRALGLVLLPFLPMGLEGVHPLLSFERSVSVTVERLVAATPHEIEEALAAEPRFDRSLPLYLRLGFPRPRAAWGDGLDPESFRAVRFTEGDVEPGILVLRVSDRAPGVVRFATVSDTSMIANWLGWRNAEVRWEEAGAGVTRVSWTLTYERRLDPAWYFGPWERYAVRRTAGYLIETLVTPAGTDRP